MERRERKNAVTVLAPAKLNLALDVVGLLPNGYHALDMTMQTITLYERVMLRRSAGLSLRLPGSLVQPNDKNTAIKAALAFFHYTGLLAGVDITIYKNTPVRAGMAGGSADAAAVLVGLNALYGAKLSMSELCALGAGIGADVPFALMGGTCRVQGVGDLLKALPPVPDCWFTVVMPDYGVSTPEAFAAYDTVGSSIHPDCEAQEKAIRAGAGKLLEKVELFDVYKGASVAPGKKSVAYSMTLRAPDRTLTVEECDRAVAKVLKELEKLGAKLRA